MKQKAKVLILSPVVPYPPTDGGRLRTYKLCWHLADRYDFTIIAVVNPDDVKPSEMGEDEFLKRVRLVPVETALARMGLPEGTRPSLPRMLSNKLREWSDPWQGMDVSFWTSKEVKTVVEKYLEAGAFDLVHIEHLHMAPYAKAIRKIPVILTEHNIESERFRDFMRRPRRLRGKWITRIVDNLFLKVKAPFQLQWVRKFESNLSRYFKLCITVSEMDKERLQKLDPTLKIEIVSNGVDTSYFKPHISKDRVPKVVFAGHMAYLPNEDAVLHFCNEILPLIRRSVPDVEFYVVGKRPLDRILQIPQKDPLVKVTGFVQDVRPYMASDFVYVAPLRIGSGTRIKILEAMAMKMAVVSTSVGCEGLEVEDGLNILIADQPADFAKKTVELIKNPEKREQIGENARRLVEEKYDWRRIADIQDEVYRVALNVDKECSLSR